MAVSAQCKFCAFYYTNKSVQQCMALERLQSASKNDCKFFKTPEELKHGRQKAFERLENLGYFDLIDQYHVKPEIGG